jgi:hypothetical protein
MPHCPPENLQPWCILERLCGDTTHISATYLKSRAASNDILGPKR